MRFFGEEEMEKFEAFWLGYIGTNGNDIRVLCENSDQADDAFDVMFGDCGDDVKYSVDGVDDLWNKFDALAEQYTS
jgi:hypothetical protein